MADMKRSLQGGEIRPAAFSRGREVFTHKDLPPPCTLTQKGLKALCYPEL
jgi:hypothetical protein